MANKEAWDKKAIVAFAGMANSPQEDVIKDEQSSDVLNLRNTEAGWLISRNGVRALEFDITADPDYGVTYFQGATSIHEYVLSEAVTDRIKFAPEGGTTVDLTVNNSPYPLTRHSRYMSFGLRDHSGHLAYVLAPAEQMPETRTEWDQSWRLSEISGTLAPTPPSALATQVIWYVKAEDQGGDSVGHAFTAPVRAMSRRVDVNGDDARWVDTVTGAVDDENWIEHYQQQAQFNDALIVADRINGDKALYDEFNEALQGETPEHRLRFQENCKIRAEVDDIIVDYEVGAGGKNAAGHETGMALYKFYLPHKTTHYMVDHYHENMSLYVGKDVEVDGEKWDWSGDTFWAYEFKDELNKLMNGSGCFLKGFTAWFHDNETSDTQGGVLKCLKANRDRRYTFTNYREPVIVSDLLGKPSLTNPDLPVEYEDGKAIVDTASDVYIWNECKLLYKTVSGKEFGNTMLLGRDKLWSKTTPIVPKIVRTKTHTGVEQLVPLGVYAYQIVWDFGNGDWSSPSAPIYAGELLWSALTDSDFRVARDEVSDEHYTRPYFWSGKGYESVEANNGKLGVQPTLGDYYTDLVRAVKSNLYDQDVVLGPNTLWSEAGTLITVFHESDRMVLEGFVLEGAGIRINVDDAAGDKNANLKAVYDNAALLQLIVPFTKVITEKYTLQSMFTDTDDFTPYGGYRKAIPGAQADYSFVFEGYNTPIGHPLSQHDELWAGKDGSSPHDNPVDEDGTEIPIAPGLPHNWPEYSVLGRCVTSGKAVWGSGESSIEIDIANLDTNHYFGRDIDSIRYQTNLYFNFEKNFSADHNNTAASGATTVLRFTSDHAQRLLNIKGDVPTEVVSRILAQGVAELKFADYGEKGICRTEYWASADTSGDGDAADVANKKVLHKDTPRTWEYTTRGYIDMSLTPPEATRSRNKGVMTLVDDYVRGKVLVYDGPTLEPLYDYDTTFIGNRYIKDVLHDTVNDPDPSHDDDPIFDPHIEDNAFANVRVISYLRGERLLLPEQLTAYFTTSMLFGCPRISIKVPEAKIPRRARRMLVFRTKVSYANDWQPNEFGLVGTVDVPRGAGVPNGDVEFYDTIKDADIDFGTSPNGFEGITSALKSRFTIPFANKMWFANFKEEYQPLAPRGFLPMPQAVGFTELKPPGMTDMYTAAWKPYNAINDTKPYWDEMGTLLVGQLVRYFIVFKDINGTTSQVKLTDQVDLSSHTGRSAVYLAMAGYPFSGAVAKCEVYRRIGAPSSSNKYKLIGEIKAEDEGVFVDTGKEPGTSIWENYDDTYEPTSVPRVEQGEAELAWSELNAPSWIKGTSRQMINQGDGEQITGMEIFYGDLLVLKENSVFRITPKDLSGDIGRIEEVANQYGCIAPNTVVSYNSTIYFLSWHGLMRYDNNKFEMVDGDFSNELQLRLNNEYRGIRNPGIRDASMAINPLFGEIYLNIPVYAGTAAYDRLQSGIKGHIYVINIESNMATKFGYETGDRQIFYPAQDAAHPKTLGTWERTMGRIYHRNTIGQLWSADILPKTPSVRSLAYIEAPTKRSYDELQPAIKSDGTLETVDSIRTEPVRVWWRSKAFFGNTKTVIKRVRKAIATFMRGQRPVIGMEFQNATYQPEAYSEAQFVQQGKLTYNTPRDPGYDRGEKVNFHMAAEGDVEITSFEFIWREVGKFTR